MTRASATLEPGPRSGFDTELPPPGYDPRDFAWFEDAILRWIGVTVYGAVLFAGGLIAPIDGGLLAGLSVVIFGAIIILFISGLIWLTVGGEAAFGALAAGVTLMLLGITALSGFDPNWNWTGTGLLVIGGALVMVGSAAAYWRDIQLSGIDKKLVG
ncbi:MAG: hypothetical protein WAN87_08825 [Thermoplasmata archaeon]